MAFVPLQTDILSPDVARAVLSAHSDPLIVLNTQHDVTFFNPAALSFAPKLILGRPLTHALRFAVLTEALRLCAADGKKRMVEVHDPVPVDRVFQAELSVSPHKDAAYIIVVRDMTAQRRSEKMRVDFIANVSHELRTPLASLMGFVETILGPAREDKTARERFLGIMLAQAKRMSRLIDDLLQLSRIELNEHVPPQSRVDLAALLDDLADTLKPVMGERNITLTLSGTDREVMVRGDRDELIRLYENLIQNAAKYGGNDKSIEVALTLQPHHVRVSVTDHGPGIAPEHLPRLTERFYRVDVAQSRSKGGTGLGLAIVKHITNRHRGKLSISSTLSQGACFTVDLPLDKALT